MINPASKDLGREVKYTDGRLPYEFGVVTGYNASYVFVRFRKGEDWTGAQACNRRQLEWVEEDFLAMPPETLLERARHDLIAEWKEKRK